MNPFTLLFEIGDTETRRVELPEHPLPQIMSVAPYRSYDGRIENLENCEICRPHSVMLLTDSIDLRPLSALYTSIISFTL